LCATGKRKLIRVDPQPEPMTTRSRKYLPRFIGRENFLFAEHIAKLSELLLRDLRQHLIDNQRHVFIASCSILRRNTVRSEKRRHITQRCLPIETLDRAQDLELVLQRQAVSRLRFNGCRSAAQKPLCVTSACRNQLINTRGARVIHRRLNSTTASCDLLVRRSLTSLLELVDARSRKHR